MYISLNDSVACSEQKTFHSLSKFAPFFIYSIYYQNIWRYIFLEKLLIVLFNENKMNEI